MKNKNKFYLILSAAALAGAVAIADSAHDSARQPNGNGAAMQHNLNYPDATVPARHNEPDYERVINGVSTICSEHPEKNLSNSYNSLNYNTK